jgi:glycerol-3-phosphate dehydrogenase
MQTFDLIVIGGGITGAGIFREAAACGLSVLLLEARDFGSGTSSRSSKLVHGGLRYLKQGALHLTLDSVRHRERLLKELPGLVTSLPFLMPLYGDTGPSALQMKAGLFLYDLMAGRQSHRFLPEKRLTTILPGIRTRHLNGAFSFEDAQVDDARLVLRLIQEGITYKKAMALNYTEVKGLSRNEKGRVTGVRALDRESGEEKPFSGRLVINATGVLAEKLHHLPDRKQQIRPLRGSHLVFSRDLLPLESAVSFLHPQDRRPVFFLPWEGALLLGTTDADAGLQEAARPRITKEETRYLLAAATHLFPHAGFHEKAILATFAGLRPVISEGGDKAPSEESREHEIWQSPGLISVTGGKLTTFRKLAWDTLKHASRQLPMALPDEKAPLVPENPIPCPDAVSPLVWQRLSCRYGNLLERMASLPPRLLTKIPGTAHLWAEIPLAAGERGVYHLDDLLLRRLRLGLLLREGGMDIMEGIRELALPVLGWREEKWETEVVRYQLLWQKDHGVPG